MTKPGRPFNRASLMYSLRSTSSMLERVRRNSEAATYQPSASDGMIRCSGPPMPLVGSQPSHTDKIRLIPSPSQNRGTARPNSASTWPALSQPLLTLTADMSPAGMPMMNEISVAAQRQLQRIGQALEIERADRHLVVERLAQITGEDVLGEGEVLHRPGAVETPFQTDAIEILGAGAGLGQQCYRVPGQPDHREDRQAQDEQSGDRVERATH